MGQTGQGLSQRLFECINQIETSTQPPIQASTNTTSQGVYQGRVISIFDTTRDGIWYRGVGLDQGWGLISGCDPMSGGI